MKETTRSAYNCSESLMSAGVSDGTLRRPLLHSSFRGPVIQYDTIRDAILTENCQWVGLGWVGLGRDFSVFGALGPL